MTKTVETLLNTTTVLPISSSSSMENTNTKPTIMASLSMEEEEEEESYCYAMQLVFSSVLSMSLQSATELGVFDIIAKAGEGAGMSSEAIAAQMAGNGNREAPVMVDRVLRLLASHSVLDCSVVGDERLYSLGRVAKYFVTNEDSVSLGPLMALIQDKIFLDSWSELKNSILEGGIPFNRVYGTHAFDYPGLDARFNRVFNTAMYNHTTIVIKKVLKIYKGFEKLKQLVDVGGGLGVTLGIITSKFSHIKAINFDLPHVIKDAPSYPGVEHVGGDMFESVPNGDAIFMKWILHDWSDDKCLRLLKNCYKAIPDEGKVIVLEATLPANPERSWGAKSTSQIDVLMMTQNPGGKERSRAEFLALAVGAGFSGIKFDCFVCNYWVMEFYK